MPDDKSSNSVKEEFSFIKEQIVQKPKGKIRRFVVLLITTIFLAIVFGIVACITYYVSNPQIKKIFGKEEVKPPFVIPTVFPEIPEYTSVTTTEEATVETTEDTTVEVNIDKVIHADLEDYKSIYGKITEVVETVNESIVVVTGVTSGVDWFNNPYESKDTTTGILISNNEEELLVLTYKSKLTDVNNIRVTFDDNNTVDATLKSYSKDIDLAIVSVKIVDISPLILDKIKVAVFGTSIALKSGTPIIAVGNPNGYNYSFETGFVSSIQNSFQIIDSNIRLFNTNIQDNPNGKGFIIDLEGKVIGIITSKFKEDLNQNINTVMSISEIRKIIDKLTTGDTKAYLGIMGLDVTEDISEQLNLPIGVYITKVITDSPAFESGLQSGDIILSINDMQIFNMNDVAHKLHNSKPKDILKIKVMRMIQNEHKEIEISVILGEM